jgi:hypothetical protein
VSDLGLGNDVTVEDMGYNPIPGRGYANVIRLSTPDGFASIIHDDNYVWIDTSQVNKKKSDGTPIDGYNDPLSREKQQLGQASYQILGLFAKNNGLKLVPDPSGVSAIADIRRIDAMLANALRTGDTSYIDFAGIGTNPRATPPGWTGGKDYVRDIGVLATMSGEYATHFFPELNKLTLSRDGTKVILDGKAYTLNNLTKHLLVGDRSAVKTGVGEKTLRRAIFSKLDSLEFDGVDVAGLLDDSEEYMRGDERGGDSPASIDRARAKLLEVSSLRVMFQPDPTSPNILNGSNGSRIIKSNSGKYRVYLATGALAGVKDSLESAQKLIETKSK